MFIQTQATPNPATVKFIPGEVVSPSGLHDFKDLEEAGNSPLAQRLFGLQGVSGVFLGPDFVSVSKDDMTDWEVLKPMVMALLMEHFTTGQPVLTDSVDANEVSEDDDHQPRLNIVLTDFTPNNTYVPSFIFSPEQL